jgi:CRP/FNR family transcriptional regulator, cyclic AMP receptor protein
MPANICDQQQGSNLKKFLKNFPLKKFKQGEVLFAVDQPLTYVCCLESGFVRQYVVSNEGEEFIQNVFKKDAIFPLNLICTQKYNSSYFEALTDVTAIMVPTSQMEVLLQKNPIVLKDLIIRLSRGINQLLYRMESLVFGSAQQRLAAMIYLLALKFGVSHKEAVKLGCTHQGVVKGAISIAAFRLTHQQLAHLTALTRETVSVEMMNLRKLGLIDYQHQKICVLKPKKLKELSSLPYEY